jgi:hypothetical protein
VPTGAVGMPDVRGWGAGDVRRHEDEGPGGPSTAVVPVAGSVPGVRRRRLTRIGTEVAFSEDGLTLGMMAGARRVDDLRRDGRMALHNSTADVDEDPTAWRGDAKVSGTAVELPGHDVPPGSHRFVVDLTEVVITRVGTPADHLVIEMWRPGSGVERIERR